MVNKMKQDKINRRFKLIIKCIAEGQTEEEVAEMLGITMEAIRQFLRNYFDTNFAELVEKYHNKK